jgi:hypothetical protein
MAATTNATSTSGGGVGSIQAILGNNSTAAAVNWQHGDRPHSWFFERLKIILHENWIYKKRARWSLSMYGIVIKSLGFDLFWCPFCGISAQKKVKRYKGWFFSICT